MANLILAILLLQPITLAAEELIVVTADRTETPYSQSASSTQVITKADIERSNASDLHQLLNLYSGVHVANSGGSGGNTSLFLRGTESNHVLVIIDGVEMNDPSNPNRQFNFALLSTADIERVEILKGSHSVLYGSDAIGGVISITTKSGLKKSQFDVGGSYGSHNSYSLRGGLRESLQNGHYSLGIEYRGTDGFSKANEKNLINAEDDGQNIYTITAKAKKDFVGFFEMEVFFRFVNDETDLDSIGSFGSLGDDPNDILKTKEIYQKLSLKSYFLDGLMESTLSISANKHKRESRDIPDSIDATSSIQENQGDLFKVSLQNNLLFSEVHTSTLGIDFEKEEDKSKVSSLVQKTATTTGIYAHHKILNEDLFTSFGARIDNHEEFGSHLTWKIAPGYFHKSTGTKFRGSISTGFKAPSLNQLYGQLGGNPNLTPEESFNYEFGVDQELSDSLEASFTFFKTNLKNRFSFDLSSQKNVNRGEANIKGLEAGLRTSFSRFLIIALDYTYINTVDESTKLALVRRPEHAFSLKTDLHFNDQWNIRGTINHIGDRDDFDSSTFARVVNPSYTTFGLGLNYQLNSKTKYWLKAENIFDEEYEEVDGFGIAGRTSEIGFDMIF